MSVFGLGKKTCLGKFTSNDNFCGSIAQTTDLQYLIYLDKYCNDLKSCLGVTETVPIRDSNEVPHWDRDGFSQYLMQALLGLANGSVSCNTERASVTPTTST